MYLCSRYIFKSGFFKYLHNNFPYKAPNAILLIILHCTLPPTASILVHMAFGVMAFGKRCEFSQNQLRTGDLLRFGAGLGGLIISEIG
jgi:hypothetical protein